MRSNKHAVDRTLPLFDAVNMSEQRDRNAPSMSGPRIRRIVLDLEPQETHFVLGSMPETLCGSGLEKHNPFLKKEKVCESCRIEASRMGAVLDE